MNNKARPIDANNIEIFLHQMRYAAATHLLEISGQGKLGGWL